MSGYIDNNKNPVFFVNILHNILKYNKQIHFIWFYSHQTNHGIGYYAELYAKYLELEHHISWVHVEQKDYFEMFAGIDAFVLTSHRESFSLVALEALYLRKPVITYQNIGGTTEILENHTDLLCKNYTVQDFVDKMLYVMDNYEHITTYQHHLERFTRDNLLVQWDTLTNDFLSK
jgi:glycosyltransferase involved in cell wall biosynthesis